MNNLRCLIVDDEPWSREVVRALGDWEKLGIEVVGEAEDGNQGLQCIEDLRPDIVVTDMRMPGLDGTVLLKAMKERYPALKIIVMSGYDDFVYLKQAIQSNARDYLLKPLDPDQLNEALARCASERRKDASERLTPFVLLEPSAHNSYLEHKNRITGYLNDRDKKETLQAFDRLGRFIAELPQEHHPGAIKLLIRDFVPMLLEYARESEVDLDWRSDLDEAQAAADVPSCIRYIADLYVEAIDQAEAAHQNRRKLNMDDVQAYVEKHYMEPISLEGVAQRFFVTKEHLSRSFKAHTNKNMTDYIVARRMEKAKEYIVDRNISIKQAAQLTGYEDITYFYRVFKKHFGVTPKELRGDER